MINWATVLQYVISGALVSWPVFIAGLIISHRKQSQLTQQVADTQTDDLKKLADIQTDDLVKKLKDSEE